MGKWVMGWSSLVLPDERLQREVWAVTLHMMRQDR